MFSVCNAQKFLAKGAGNRVQELHETVKIQEMCCLGSAAPGELWIRYTERHGRPMLYATGIGLFPGAFVDAANVAKISGAAPNSPGDFAISAQAAETPRKAPPMRTHRKMATAPKFAQRKRIKGAGPLSVDPIEYVGCYKERHGARPALRDLVWGPQRKGFNRLTCAGACPDKKYMSLEDGGYCACDNSFSTPSVDFPLVPDKECDTGKQGVGMGAKGRASVYYLGGKFPDPKTNFKGYKWKSPGPCRDYRRRRRMKLMGLKGFGMNLSKPCTACAKDFATKKGFDYEGHFWSKTAKVGSMMGKGKKKAMFNDATCANICFQEHACLLAVFKCNGAMCQCKMYRHIGKKSICKDCTEFKSLQRSDEDARKEPSGPAPPPMYPPLPPHCGGSLIDGVKRIKTEKQTKEKAAKAHAIAAAAAAGVTEMNAIGRKHVTPVEKFNAGEYKGNKEKIKYAVATFNMEDEAGGCQVASAQGRRKLKLVLGRGKFPQLAEIDFTFMSLKVCKAMKCEKDYRLLTCHIQWMTPVPMTIAPTKKFTYDPPGPCTYDAKVAAMNNM